MALLPVTRCGLGVLALVAATTSPARAQYRDPYDGNWHFSFAPYLWLPGFDGDFRFKTPSGAGGSPLVHAESTNVLSLVNLAFMANADMRKGKWSLLADFAYVDLSDDRARMRTITAPSGMVEVPVNVATTASLEGYVLTLGMAYSVYHDRDSMIDVLLGTRYLESRVSTSWNITGSVSLLPHSGRTDQKTGLWDAIIGVKGRYGFSGTHWFVDGYADVGTGASDITCYGVAGFGYAFDWGDVTLNYRYMHYGRGTRLFEDLSLPGPSLGVRFQF